MTISSIKGTRLLPELSVSVRLLDDFGTISLNITTQEDFMSGTDIFKPDFVTDFSTFTVTKRLD